MPLFHDVSLMPKQDQDAWGGGSSGSLKKTVTVHALDGDEGAGVECRQADYTCQGVYHCPYLHPSILQDVERYEPDMQEVEHLAALQRKQNAVQTSSETTEAIKCV